MKIAIFSNSFPLLSETFVINQIVGLIELGVDVDIISNETRKYDLMHSTVEKHLLLERLFSIGLDTQESKYKRVARTIFNLMSLVAKRKIKSIFNVFLDKNLKLSQKLNLISALNKLTPNKLKYDNIICHFGNHGYYICKLRELGLISGNISTVFHGYELSRHNIVEEYLEQYKRLFITGDLMLPISELWKRKLISLGCHPSKVKVHRMGIDIDDFKLKDVLTPLAKPLKIIQVGRLTEKKAILDSINAVYLSSNKILVEFVIIGDGELYDEAKALIKSLNAEEYIHLLGKQPQSEVKRYLDEADVFMLPSITARDGDMEGIPVALMEAMAKGLIVLSTNHSGIPELIQDKISGFLVKESSVLEISHTINKISGLDQEQLLKIRRNAREVVMLKFNNDILNKKLLECFSRI